MVLNFRCQTLCPAVFHSRVILLNIGVILLGVDLSFPPSKWQVTVGPVLKNRKLGLVHSRVLWLLSEGQENYKELSSLEQRTRKMIYNYTPPLQARGEMQLALIEVLLIVALQLFA